VGKHRLEAFSDGVIAIIITVMVLELKIPETGDFSSLRPLVPKFISYALSFVFVAIYWNNHHHFFHVVEYVNGKILWANMHLLFWLSLTPFVTGWMGENDFSRASVIAYGFVAVLAAFAYTFLTFAVVASQGASSRLKAAIGSDRKSLISLLLYVIGIGVAFASPIVSVVLYGAVSAVWFIPDARIERRVNELPAS
jgi:uncharacterized membrane protein